MGNNKTSKNSVRKEIAALIDNIKEQADRIGYRKDVPQIEVDLIIHKIEQLYRKSVVYSYLNSIEEHEETAEEVIPPVSAEVREETVVVPVNEVIITEAPVQEEIVVVVEREEPVIEKETDQNNEPETKKESEPQPEQEIKVDNTVKVEVNPVSVPSAFPDIRRLIGFNERIMFLRNLFGSDLAVFEEMMDQINNCSSYDEAQALISAVSGELGWQSDDETFEVFMNVVKRRFSVK
ncbi:MAG: hypothetical protein Fur0041_02330 [Bacteroidia bacterium]